MSQVHEFRGLGVLQGHGYKEYGVSPCRACLVDLVIVENKILPEDWQRGDCLCATNKIKAALKIVLLRKHAHGLCAGGVDLGYLLGLKIRTYQAF